MSTMPGTKDALERDEVMTALSEVGSEVRDLSDRLARLYADRARLMIRAAELGVLQREIAVAAKMVRDDGSPSQGAVTQVLRKARGVKRSTGARDWSRLLRCPICGAERGEACVDLRSPGEGRPLRVPHPHRPRTYGRPARLKP